MAGAGCGGDADKKPGTIAAVGELPPLIPRATLFGAAEKSSVLLSPDGKQIAYIAPDQAGISQVWLRTIGKNDGRMLTTDKDGISECFWAFDGQHLLFRREHLFALNLASGAIRVLTPFPGVTAHYIHLHPDFPEEVLVGLNLRDRHRFDQYRVNLSSATVEFDTTNPGNVVGWLADANLKIRAAVTANRDGGNDLLYRDKIPGAWNVIRRFGPDEGCALHCFSEDGNTLYLNSNHDAPAQRLLVLHLATKKESVLAEDPNYDVFMVWKGRGRLDAAAFFRDKLAWQPLAKEYAADFAALAKICAGRFVPVKRDLQDKTWQVNYPTDDGPLYHYVYDRESKTAQLLFSDRPKLEGLKLAKMRPISYQSGDGWTIHGYLTTPVGVPAKNLPTVLLVHGGPWSRDHWGFDPKVQWLANRGYAVLQVNFRGSAGYGNAFLRAGFKEWGRKMHDDLIDGVAWLKRDGICDPERIGIMGDSYGGYAALAGLAFTPDAFACGVDLAGPSNLVSWLRTNASDLTLLQPSRRIGDLETEEAFLKARSPFFVADRIKAPLLIAHGARDPRVSHTESDQMFVAIRQAKLPVEYIVYPEEGHGFARQENYHHFLAHVEKFLATHLGGRAEPVGEIQGHSGLHVDYDPTTIKSAQATADQFYQAIAAKDWDKAVGFCVVHQDATKEQWRELGVKLSDKLGDYVSHKLQGWRSQFDVGAQGSRKFTVLIQEVQYAKAEATETLYFLETGKREPWQIFRYHVNSPAFLELPSKKDSTEIGSEAPFFLWKISAETNTAYLLGGVFTKDEYYPLPAEIQEAFARCKTLVIDHDPSTLDPTEREELWKTHATYPGGQSLSGSLSPRTLDLLKTYCAGKGMKLQDFESLRPWAAWMRVLRLEAEAVGLNSDHEDYFVAWTKACGKPVIGLQSPHAPIRELAGWAPALQETALAKVLGEAAKTRQDMDQIWGAWRAGDLKRMEDAILSPHRQRQEWLPLLEKLYDERNVKLAGKIQGLLKECEPYFVVLRAGNVVGEKGVLNLLRAKKYTIEQLHREKSVKKAS